MKIALLSFHNAYNYGAALQAYGLQYAVQKLGVDCEYIDYQNERRKFAYDMNKQILYAFKRKDYVRSVKLICGKPFIERRGKRFDKFYDNYLNKTKKTYHSSKELLELNDEYDKFIVGSDQVWNYDNNGADWAFLLDFVKDNNKKISYSSSFGISRIPDIYLDDYKKNLSSFSRLAVREKLGVDLVKQLTGRTAHLVLDPVFLAGRECWDQIAEPVDANRKPYIFFYTNRPSQINDFLQCGYDTNGMKFHILSSHVAPKDFINPKVSVLVDMSPGRFIKEIRDAELVVTASFHCAAMAIIYHKPLCVILTGNYGRDERLLSLLSITNLKSRIFDLNSKAIDFKHPIDYHKVDALLKPYLKVSKEYLHNAIFSLDDVSEVHCNDDLYHICQDSRCTGCMACKDICPTKAIEANVSADGFVIPYVKLEKCIHCQKCNSVCQVYTSPKVNEDSFNQEYWAFKSSSNVRDNSSSGGIFFHLASKIINNGGVVCAATMTEDFTVKHILAKTIEDIQRMQGTYYVQSDLGNSFSTVKEVLLEGKKVLFVGTPCQVQGLKLYLGKEYANLCTVDLICHGVPSPKVFKIFITYLKSKGSLLSFKFRDKSLGWKGYQVSAVINNKYISNKLWLQSFNNLFSHNIINRLSCASCQFTSYNRCSDITIGDYWGGKKYHPDFIDSKGVSLVLINTKIGKNLFSQISDGERLSLDKNETSQNSLTHPSNVSGKRYAFFHRLETTGYESTLSSFAECNIFGFLKNTIRKLIG